MNSVNSFNYENSEPEGTLELIQYLAIVRRFSGMVTGCEYDSIHNYWNVTVSAANESVPEGDMAISCISYDEPEPGDAVKGLTCKMCGNELQGVILPKKYEPLLELDGFEAFMDSVACDFNREYYLDYDNNNTPYFFKSKFSDDADQKYCSGQDASSILLKRAHITACELKNRRKYVSAEYDLVDDGTKIIRYLHFQHRPDSEIYVLLFRGINDHKLHSYPLYFIYNNMLQKNYELFEQFFNDPLFITSCRMISINSKNIVPACTPVRILIVNMKKQGDSFIFFGRPISARLDANGEAHEDMLIKSNKTRLKVGYIHEATALPVSSESDNNGLYMYKLKILETQHTEASRRDAKAVQDETEKAGFNKAETEKAETEKAETEDNVTEDDEAEDNETAETAEESMTLLSIHPYEYSVLPQTPEYSYNTSHVQLMIERGTIWKLHYDILEWVGRLEFATVLIIQKLLSAGYITGSYPDCVLSEEYQKQIDSYKVIEKKVKKDKEDNETVTYELPVSTLKFSKVLSTLFNNLMLDCVKFQNEKSDKPALAKVYMLSSKGSTLMQVMNRCVKNRDEFAFARSPIEIKSILSGNQLYAAYLCSMREYIKVEESNIRKTHFTAQANSRPKFDIIFRNCGKKLNIWAESIRGYIGASEEYHLTDMIGKIVRYKATIHSLSEADGEAYCLVFVCQSYNKMKENVELILNALDGECRFTVLLTYDMAVLGRFEHSHFLLNQQTRQLEKTGNILDFFNALSK